VKLVLVPELVLEVGEILDADILGFPLPQAPVGLVTGVVSFGPVCNQGEEGATFLLAAFFVLDLEPGEVVPHAEPRPIGLLPDS